MKKTVKLTLISYIIASAAALGSVNASASCLSGLNLKNFASLQNVLGNQTCGTATLQSILSGKGCNIASLITGKLNCAENKVQSNGCEAGNTNCTAGNTVCTPDGSNCNTNNNTSSNTNSSGTTQQADASYAEEVLKYVNEARKANGLEALSLHSTLNKAAGIRAEEIKKSFSHTRPNGKSCFTVFAEVGYTYRSAGENIAYGYKDAKSVVNAWLASPGHRANILSTKYTYMGLAKNGTHWAQLFSS